MTPTQRLRKAVRLMDQIDEWNDRTDRLPDYIRTSLDMARGLVAVTIHDTKKSDRTREALIASLHKYAEMDAFRDGTTFQAAADALAAGGRVI